ncbi:MAG: hypothetical protein LBQ27_02000 [Clostridiales bacterium]|jgi:hypothetical protein|nr:hypothetical protein [Clostridiales bacterium]
MLNPYDTIKNTYKAMKKFRETGYETGYLGNTVLGSPIPYVKKGDDRFGSMLIFGAIHAREYITAPLVTRLAEEYDGKPAVYFAPLINVDGVALCTLGVDAVDEILRREKAILNPENPCFFYANYSFSEQENPAFSMPSIKCRISKKEKTSLFDTDAARYDYTPLVRRLIRINKGNRDFSLWKANVDAVDLNVNFDADWGTGVQNVRSPSVANYIGPYPESEPETKALVNFTKEHDFFAVLCYHCKGEVIYYGYKNNMPYPRYAKLFSDALGYPLEESVNSAGGYKDWFTMRYDRLALTVEVGAADRSYAELNADFESIYERNSAVLPIIKNMDFERF